MSSKIIPAGELQGQALPTLQFASFGQITPNSRLARVAAAVTPKVTLPASVDLGALLAAAGVDDPTAQAVDSSFAADPVEAINDSLPPSMQLDADEASALLAPVEGFDEQRRQIPDLAHRLNGAHAEPGNGCSGAAGGLTFPNTRVVFRKLAQKG